MSYDPTIIRGGANELRHSLLSEWIGAGPIEAEDYAYKGIVYMNPQQWEYPASQPAPPAHGPYAAEALAILDTLDYGPENGYEYPSYTPETIDVDGTAFSLVNSGEFPGGIGIADAYYKLVPIRHLGSIGDAQANAQLCFWTYSKNFAIGNTIDVFHSVCTNPTFFQRGRFKPHRNCRGFIFQAEIWNVGSYGTPDHRPFNCTMLRQGVVFPAGHWYETGLDTEAPALSAPGGNWNGGSPDGVTSGKLIGCATACVWGYTVAEWESETGLTMIV